MGDRGRTALVRVMAHDDARPDKGCSAAPRNRRRPTPLQANLSMLRMEFNRASRRLSRQGERVLAAAETMIRQVFRWAR